MDDNPTNYYARAFNRSEIQAIESAIAKERANFNAGCYDRRDLAQAIREQNRRAAFERMTRVIAWAVATGFSWALIMAVGVAVFNFYFY